MKTPKELLLSKHQAAEPHLDAIRRQVLATSQSEEAVEESSAGVIGTLVALFRIPRPAWAALGAAWIVIMALNIASRETVTTAHAELASNPSPTTLAVLQEQRRLYAELVRPPEMDAEPVRHRPRSEAPHSFEIV